MNNTFEIAAMALGAAALVLTACTKEKSLTVAEGELVECILQADVIGTGAYLDIDTKVALNADGETPNWQTGDQILVLDAEGKPVGTNGIFTLSSGAGTASGTFTGKAKSGQTPAYAIYPVSAATVSGTNPVTAGTLVASTGDDAGSIKGAVMLGTSSDGTAFTFTNACAVLKFNTGDYGKSGGDLAITSVKVSASYNSTAAPLAGAFDINWTATPPTIAAASSGTETVLTVNLPSTLQANDKDVYIPIFPQSAATSMMYEFTDASNKAAKVDYNFFAAIAGGTLKDLGIARDLVFDTN